MKTLREYANIEGITYAGAYKRWTQKRIPDAFQDSTGAIYVGRQDDIPEKQNAPILFDNLPPTVATIDEAVGSVRTNKSAFIRLDNRYLHLENSPVPFSFSSNSGYKSSDITVRDAIILCQRAYWGFSIFRATIELFTEFCVNNIYFKGGSKTSRTFFDLYFKKIDIDKLQDMFYRELWRSGNCFIYRYFGKLQGPEFKQMLKLFGGNVNRTNAEIPIEYSLLNPAFIHAEGNITFNRSTYLQLLSDYELERLRNPRTAQDRSVLESLSPEEREKIKSRKSGAVYRELDVRDIVAIFLSKQSYEAFSVPLGFGVLEHLNHKKELELMDQAIARTIQQSILLVKTGAPPDKGGINYKNIENLTNIFKTETVSRTVVADYTTEAEFVIPTVGDILDPKKYEELNQSIAIGLGNVFLIQGEKFANQSAKIDIFLQRLQGARRLFINRFLIPEMENISRELGLKGEIPQPYYEEIDLKNEIEYGKIYVRLMELGLLSLEEGLTAIETGRLPTQEDSEESQRRYKQLRDAGLYQPLLNKIKEEEGRKQGVSVPTQKKRVGPIGGSQILSIAKVKDVLFKSQGLEEKLFTLAKSKFSTEKFADEQILVLNEIVVNIMINEAIDEWNSKAGIYLDNPLDILPHKLDEINIIQENYGFDRFLAAVLMNSVL